MLSGKERLAHRRAHHVWRVRLGDEEGRLRAFASEQTIWEGGDENHRHFERRENFFHRIDAGRTVGQLNVSKHKIGTLALRCSDGGRRRRLNRAHVVSCASDEVVLKSIAMTASSSMMRMRALV